MSLSAQRLLDRRQSCLQRLELLRELVACLLAALGQLGARLLAPPRDLVANAAATPRDLVQKVRRALARLGSGGGLERALDRRAQRIRYASLATLRRSVRALATHSWQHNPHSVTVHLRPTAPIAADALLPGDPGRALALAQTLLSDPRMANHHRGLWGYTGTASHGQALTIQSTGIGGPSAAVVLEELIGLGVRRAVRIGTCTALDGELALGELLTVWKAVSDDGASRALGAQPAATPDPALHAALGRAPGAAAEAIVASTDLFYDPDGDRRRAAWLAAGASAVELGTAALFAVGRRRGAAIASCLVVGEVPSGERLDDSRLEEASVRAARLAAEALAA